MVDNTNKCKHDGVVIKPDGVHPLDPCIYKEVQVLHNVTVIISECKNCGDISISWKRQDNTWEE